MSSPKNVFVLDDSELNIPAYSPVCAYCAHIDLTQPKRVCRAFPQSIPPEIWNGANPHTKPYAGDKGIRFTPRVEGLETK